MFVDEPKFCIQQKKKNPKNKEQTKFGFSPWHNRIVRPQQDIGQFSTYDSSNSSNVFVTNISIRFDSGFFSNWKWTTVEPFFFQCTLKYFLKASYTQTKIGNRSNRFTGWFYCLSGKFNEIFCRNARKSTENMFNTDFRGRTPFVSADQKRSQ